MRLLHIITGLAVGGAETALYNLLRGGLSHRFRNSVVSLGDLDTIGHRILEEGVSVTALGMRGVWSSPSWLKCLYSAIRGYQPDIIQGWMYHGNFAAWIGRIIAGNQSKLVWNIRHSLYDLRHERMMTRHVIRANRLVSSTPEVILYNSRISRSQHEAFGFARHNGRVIANGIDLSRFAYAPEVGQRVRSELGIPGDASVVGHVARLHPMKDHHGFLISAVEVARRFPDTYFLMIGQGVSLDNEALTMLIPAQMRGRFRLLGKRNDVPDLMNAMDVYCQSSWSEAFPNVLGEAMASGVPCVATNVGDSSDIVSDTGVVVPPKDTNALVAGIEGLLAMAPDERCRRGRAARCRIKKSYAIETILDQYAELYERVLAEREFN